jgi:hypothetical protein
MTDLHVTLVTDGASDRVLLRHLRWLLEQHLCSTISIQPQWADLSRLRQKARGLGERVRSALELYPCDMLFIHRDAEEPNASRRYEEIEQVAQDIGGTTPAIVSVVPIRMTEAWLLFDEGAIRRAAGNPKGRDSLSLPTPIAGAECLPDPKDTLRDALRSASGLTGRRRRKFAVSDAVYRVAEYVDDFSPLRGLSAFDRLEKDLVRVIREKGWD